MPVFDGVAWSISRDARGARGVRSVCGRRLRGATVLGSLKMSAYDAACMAYLSEIGVRLVVIIAGAGIPTMLMVMRDNARARRGRS